MAKHTCNECDEKKPTKAFGSLTRNGKVYRHKRCRSCRSAAKVAWRRNTPGAMKKNTAYTRAIVIRLREEVAAFKAERPCVDCKKYWNPWQLQFDHVAGNKVDNVSDLVGRGVTKKAREEIAKCEIVCANCHADRTHQRRQLES